MSVQTTVTPVAKSPAVEQQLRLQQQALGASAPMVLDISKAKGDLGLVGPQDIKLDATTKTVDPELDRQASDFVSQLLTTKVDDEQGQEDASVSVENIGVNVERRATTANALLKQPLSRLGQFGGGEGQQIAQQLSDLKVQFDQIDPSRFNFEPGWVGRVLGRAPVVGKQLNKYFTQYQSSGSIIQSCFDSLDMSNAQLLRDIDTLRGEQVTMRSATKQLQKLITTCELIDLKLSDRAAQLESESDESKFINTKLIYPLRQRVTDLQQQLIVNQQGVIMYEVLVENNKELVRGVKRCKNVTYPALIIGVTAAQALANQKIVLDKITALDGVADRAISFNASLLRTTGVEIHKRSASAQLSDSGLAKAMKDAIMALSDVESFRQKALEQMGAAIAERDSLTGIGEKAIQQMERGRKGVIALKLDDEEVTATGRLND